MLVIKREENPAGAHAWAQLVGGRRGQMWPCSGSRSNIIQQLAVLQHQRQYYSTNTRAPDNEHSCPGARHKYSFLEDVSPLNRRQSTTAFEVEHTARGRRARVLLPGGRVPAHDRAAAAEDAGVRAGDVPRRGGHRSTQLLSGRARRTAPSPGRRSRRAAKSTSLPLQLTAMIRTAWSITRCGHFLVKSSLNEVS